MMTLNRYRLRSLAKKSRAAQRAEQMLKRPDRLLSVVLIGNTIANILSSAIATLLAQRLFGDVGVAITAISLTFIILLFAEALPKNLAAIKPEAVAFPISLPLKFFIKLFYPLIVGLSFMTNGILCLFGVSVHDRKEVDPLTSEELRSVVHASSSALACEHKNMLLGVLDLEKETVRGAMLSRQNIVGLDLNDPWPVILQQLQTSPFSKLPVYRDSIDNLIGILPLRKVLTLPQTLESPNTHIEHLLNPPYFIPETTTLQQQLINFQTSAEHMAFVVDEYGDIQGLVTVEDILEEIVGEFTNINQPSAHINTKKLSHGAFLVDGGMTLRDLNRDLDIDLPIMGPRTLSGLIVEYLETIPVTGISLKINDYPLEIIEVDENAVKFAKIFPKLINKKI